jgi:hypothetical protein
LSPVQDRVTLAEKELTPGNGRKPSGVSTVHCVSLCDCAVAALKRAIATEAMAGPR